MKLDPKKIVFNKALNLEEAIRVFSVLMEVIDSSSMDDNYFYVYVRDDFDLFV
jgi:hypothetical protein